MTRVAVCQLEGRPLEAAGESLAACGRLVTQAADLGADIAVLPEGAYPAYVLGDADEARATMAAGPDPVEHFGALAAGAGLVLVAGLVVDDGSGGLLNAAVTFAADGREIARTAKRFLWHFDRRWFVGGRDSPVVASEVGTIGSLVCADARLPEITRSMALGGAGLVCDPTAWVTSTPSRPSNIQPEFLIAARCIENGIVMACASKAGYEGPTVAYTGRSMVVGPDGSTLAEAPTRGDTVVVADVDLSGLPNPPVTRRPDLYRPLLASGSGGEEPSAPAGRVRLAALPEGRPLDGPMRARLTREDVDLAVGGDAVLDLASGEAVSGSPVHGPDAAATGTIGAPRATAAGRVGVLAGPDVLVPEQARIAVLSGAQVLAVVGAPDVPRSVLRARAAENRVYVVAGGRSAVVVDPHGAVVAESPAGSGFVASADAFLPLTGWREMAPATDVVGGRQPETYGSLTRPTPGRRR